MLYYSLQKFYLYNLRLSNKQVSNSHDTISDLCLQDAITSAKCALELKNLLVLAGFTIVYEDEECDIDFTNPSKDLFINLNSSKVSRIADAQQC